jgi:GPH family glycoside/pentoside/hexuronide:cation symporter
MTPIKGRIPTPFAFTHGLGSIAYGVKDNGFSTFLLLFYNQVLGMDARLVGAALALALVLDAFIDPVIGHLSDRTYTRWGRRLPWLYIAPWPLALAWYMLWSVEGAPGFWQLVVTAMAVRALVSACEVPSVALVPELTRDYDERSRLMRYRYLFGWGGGLFIMTLGYTVFMGDDMLSAEGYYKYGIAGSLMMLGAVVISALGQHKVAAHYPLERPAPQSLGHAFKEIVETLSHPAFLILMAAGALAYTSQGITFTISNYLYLFVWRMQETMLDLGFLGTYNALKIYPFFLFLSVVVTFFSVGPMHARWGKRTTGAVTAFVGMVFWVVPFILRHFGLWWPDGSLPSTLVLFGFIFGSNVFSVAAIVSAASMVADVVEASEEQTGRRSEGTFFAGNFFVQKCATGLGIFFTGFLVQLAGMPEKAVPGQVAESVIDTLALSYSVIVAVFAIGIALILRRFPITRENHAARLSALAAAGRGDPDASGAHP